MAVVFPDFARGREVIFDEADQSGVTVDDVPNRSIPCPLGRATVVNVLSLGFSDIQRISKHVDQYSDLQIYVQGGGRVHIVWLIENLGIGSHFRVVVTRSKSDSS
jgi:hypothetical protein